MLILSGEQGCRNNSNHYVVSLSVVTKLVNRGYQPHLEDFLLRINFNNYYKDS